MDQIKYASVGRLNILGGNILQYPYVDDLMNLLLDFQEQTYFWIHYQNIIHYEKILPDYRYIIPVTFPMDEKSFADCAFILKDKQVSYHFFITSETEYNQ